MATYYTNPSNQRDGAPMFYTRENMAGSYQENSVIPGNMMMYLNSGSFSDSLAGNSQQEQADREVLSVGGEDGSAPPQQEMLSVFEGSRLGEQDYNAWRDGRNEMLLMQSVGASSGMLGGQQNLHGQGLSLSLSTRIPSGIQIPTEYFPPSGFPGGNKGNLSDLSSPYAMSCAARNIPGSKYLKAAQQLLDEVVNVRRALKQPEDEKNNKDEEMEKGSGEGERNEASNPQESSSGAPSELSQAERQDLQNKLTKLLSMLDEVDRRYKQYYHQMQIVVSSFDAIAGCGAAKPYTALALQTISRHFRCLRDAITGQIRAARKSLGEQDTSLNGNGVGISRLRFVDQQLRQQRALQQLGMMQQHAWRPQRGLPESSVSVLRAWLFEHFLHPYPKDSDKIMLARQTGLTRSQVSNWFINARVRLWKPMVEEMYKEEAGDAEMESNSSSENNAGRGGTKGDETRNPDDNRGQDIGQSLSSTEMASFHNRPDMGIDDCSNLYPDNRSFMAPAYQIPTGTGSGVSLTLGLQHCDGASLNSFVPISGDGVYNAVTGVGASSSEAADFECIDAGHRQHRFNSSQLLHDFVA